MTLTERAESYAAAFPQFPASHLRVVEERGGPCLYGTWLLGNDYRVKSGYYGGYPKGYLDRVMALFREENEHWTSLHVFAGSLPRNPAYIRLDVNAEVRPDYVGSVYDVADIFEGWPPEGGSFQTDGFRLVLADPPYSPDDAERYGTPMVDRRRAMASLAQVTRVGGHLVWLDTVWPMFRRAEWRTVGRITLIRSTNHRVRLISIFERVSS